MNDRDGSLGKLTNNNNNNKMGWWWWRKQIQINRNRENNRNTTMGTLDIDRVIKKHYKLLQTNKPDDSEDIDGFLDTYNLPII